MTDVFERLAPQWRNAVKTYALSVWRGKDLDDARLLYDAAASRFAKRYRRELEDFYADKGMRVYRGTLDGKVKEWLSKQTVLRDALPQAINDRQQELVEREIERLRKAESPDAQKMLDKLYDARKGENVYKVFSFAESYEAKAEQIGDENAYNLGTEINEGIIKQFSDRYIWRTQRDRRVRETHRKLANKCFLFDDPPTEVSKSGKAHTGNPGTSWGCVPGDTKIRLDSDIIRCFRRKFTGELTFLVTESGITIRTTGNHPVLTQSGWKPANLVNVGDYVAKIPEKSVNALTGDIYNTGVPIEKIFDFISLCGDKESIPGSSSQFHGDGIPEEKVDIVTVNWELTDKRDVLTGEKISKLIFPDADVVPGHLLGSSESEFDSACRRLGLSSFGGMSRSRDFHSLFGSGILKADDIGLASVSCFDPFGYNKTLHESASRRVSEEIFGASESTHSGRIGFNDFFFERVVEVDVIVSDCHVYNLQTATNWYIANGLSIHNCRCWAEIPDKKIKPLRGYVVHER